MNTLLKAVFVVLFLSLSCLTYAENFVAGTDYEVLSAADKQKTSLPTVTEFFSFGCPWCFRLEPTLEKWLATQGNKIHFSRTPVVFNPDWEYYAKAYYVAKTLSEEKKLTPVFFQAIIQNKQKLASNQAMIAFFKAQGADAALVESAFEHSLTIDMQVNDAKEAMKRDHIMGVPAFVVNGRFKTDLQMAKSEERLFAILDFLLTQH